MISDINSSQSLVFCFVSCLPKRPECTKILSEHLTNCEINGDTLAQYLKHGFWSQRKLAQ